MGIAYAQEATEDTVAEQTPGEDVAGQIDVNPASIFERLDSWVDGFVRLIPNIVTAFIVIAIAFGIGVLVRRFFNAWARRRERANLGTVFGSFLKWLIVGVGILLGLTIVIPTLNPGDLIAGLGVSSVAIGFAFKDILQNWLAGMLLLFRQPFEVGDQIIAEGHEGTVERIESRVTVIRTYDSRNVLIPNSDVYTNAVVVNTTRGPRRSQYDMGIGMNDDADRAIELMEQMMANTEGVITDPAPEVLCVGVGDFALMLRARWWTDPDQSSVVHTRSRIILAFKKAFDSDGIDMPYPTHIHLFHDQTEETDGERGRQREGWPSSGDDPKPARLLARQRRDAIEDATEEPEGSA